MKTSIAPHAACASATASSIDSRCPRNGIRDSGFGIRSGFGIWDLGFGLGFEGGPANPESRNPESLITNPDSLRGRCGRDTADRALHEIAHQRHFVAVIAQRD